MFVLSTSLGAYGPKPPQATRPQSEPIVLRVQSVHAGTEVRFKAAIVVGFGSRLRYVEGTTPFEVSGVGAYGVAIIEGQSDRDTIFAEMKVAAGSALESHSSASGTGTILLTMGLDGRRTPTGSVR